MSNISKKHPSVDYALMALILGLLVVGLAVLYSASMVESYKNTGRTTHYIVRQLAYGGLLGLTLMYICSKIDYHHWKKIVPVAIIASLIALLLVKVPGIGIQAGGAFRWIDLGPFSFQPSELAKLAVILYLAAWVDRRNGRLSSFSEEVLPPLLVVGLFSFLILSQPDFGTMLVLIAIALGMIFVGGINLKYFFWTIVAGALSLVGLVFAVPYRAKRVATFLDPSIDPQGSSYQINQALLAIGAGGLWGYGYGLSRQKYNYLPETLNDSVFAVLAEELGFVRVTAVLALFTLLAIKGLAIAKAAPDIFGRMLAVGITVWITVQAIINIGAMLGLMPLTGVPLPFFSYGSTALILVLGATGILLNISRQAKLKKAV